MILGHEGQYLVQSLDHVQNLDPFIFRVLQVVLEEVPLAVECVLLVCAPAVEEEAVVVEQVENKRLEEEKFEFSSFFFSCREKADTIKV